MLKPSIVHPPLGTSDERTWICLLGVKEISKSPEVTFFTLEEGYQEEKRVAYHGDITFFRVSRNDCIVKGLENVSLFGVRGNKPILFLKDRFFYIPYHGRDQFSEAFVSTDLLNRCDYLSSGIENKSRYFYEELDDIVNEISASFLLTETSYVFNGLDARIPYIMNPLRI